MPFTLDEFLAVFAVYNRAVGPLGLALAEVAGLAAAALILAGPVRAQRAAWGFLAALWAGMAAGYLGAFFSAINPAAYGFAVLFAVQAGLLAWLGAIRGRVRTGDLRGPRGWTALVLAAYALVAYPLIGLLGFPGYPAAPLFGVAPCPTVILTLALLLPAKRGIRRMDGIPWELAIIPLLWTGVGGSAAWLLRIPQDYGLIAAGILLLGLGLGTRAPEPA